MYKRIEKFINDLVKLNLDNKYIDKLTFNTIYLYIFLLPLPMFMFMIIRDDLFTTIYRNMAYLFIPALLYVFVYYLKNKRIKVSVDFILLSLFILISFVSCFTSINFFKAFEGSNLRTFGFVEYILLYLMYFDVKVISSKENIIKFIELFFFMGIIQVIFALFESYGTGKLLFFPKDWDQMAYGLCMNPNFFGTYSMVLCLLSFLMVLFYDKKNIFYKITCIMMFIGMILSCSTGPFLSFCLMLIIILIYNKVKNKKIYDRIIIWLLIFILLYTIFDYSNIYINERYRGSSIPDSATISGDIKILTQAVINKTSKLITGHELLNITNISDSNIGSGRISVWKETIKYIERDNHIWLGSGPDSLSILYYPGVDDGVPKTHLDLNRIDKAHNIYLNVLASTGIFSFILYMGWLFIVHKQCLKNNKNNLVIILFLCFIGYNIQGLFNINVVEVMPYYVLICGLMMGMVNSNAKNSL